jgi:hypothetical protein
MKQNLKEEIERNLELMELQLNEDWKNRLSYLIKNKIEKLKDKISGSKDETPEPETENEPTKDINSLEKDSEEEKEFLDDMTSELNIKDVSGLSTCNCKFKRLKSTDYFIIHHTAGHNTCEGTVNTLNNRKNERGEIMRLGIQWIVDRDGNLCQALPLNSVGYHIMDSPTGANNFNTQGVEVVGDNDNDILPVQAITVLKLIKKLGIPLSKIYGHGEVNKHKAATEGKTIKKFILANYNETNPNNYDFSMFKEI